MDRKIDERCVRIAIAGAGLAGRQHVSAIASTEGAVLSAVADPDTDTRAYAKSAGAAPYGDLATLIAADRPDAVIVASPNQTHLESATTAIRAGIPTLVEKPITPTEAEGEELVAFAEAEGVPLLAGHHRRHNPLIAAAKAAIDAGRLGRIVTVHGMFWLYKPEEYFSAEWRRAPGAGPIFINLIHDIDLLRHLVGDITEVHAVGSNSIRGHAVEDTACVLLRFETGALGTINLSDTVVAPWSWELTAGENPVYPKTDQACYLLGGTHASLELPRNRIWFNSGTRSWWEPIHSEDIASASANSFVRQIENLRDVVLGCAQPHVPGAEGLKSLAAIEAVEASARTGQSIRLDDRAPAGQAQSDRT